MPLTYPSLKCVIKHMEVNSRIQLSQRCPSIRKAEKSIPLKIGHLELDQCRVKINNTDYSLAVVCNYFSSPYDLDEVGSMDLGEVIDEQRDVVVDNRSLEEGEKRILRMEYELRMLTDDWEKKNALIGEALKKELKMTTEKSELVNRKCYVGIIKSLFLSRRVGVPAPIWDIDFVNKNKLITFRDEKLSYNMKLHQAFKYLIFKLFSGRRDAIQVKKLSIENKGILRVPASLNLKVTHLEILGSGVDKIAISFQPLLEGSSLQSIKLNNDFNIENPILQTSPLLIFKNPNENLFRARSAFTNVRVELEKSTIFPREALDLIANWLRHGKEVGTIWNFSLTEVTALVCFKDIRKLPGAKYAGHKTSSQLGRSVLIPINAFSEIHIFDEKEEAQDGNDWSLKITVRRKL